MIKTTTKIFLLSLSFFVIGCATSVSRFSKEGKVSEVIFPDINKAWKKDGVIPNSESLVKIKPSLNKDKVYALLGTPHFSEGFGAVKEWDYIFHFNEAAQNNADEVCQFKIIFNVEMRVQDTYWKPSECAKYASLPKPSTAVVTEKIIEKEKETITLSSVKMSSDGFFEFDKFGMSNLQPGGRERLDKTLSEILSKGELVSVKVVGYTDRLGSDEYNIKLSESRANTIKDYIASRGDIPADKIFIQGLGKSDPVVQCNQEQRNTALINCLQPNRRFEIEIETVKKVSLIQ